MAENETSDERFEELRQRWEQDPSSRIFMQLAEEYRRRGEPQNAVAVLEQGLQHHPGSVAAQVALGRCRLEAGLVEPALAALEAVVRKDPTNMVAYRLLVEGYLQQGDAESAKDRLEVYSQLNAQDPEIEGLTDRIRQIEARLNTAGEDLVEPAAPAAPVPPDAPGQIFHLPVMQSPPVDLSQLSPRPLAPVGAWAAATASAAASPVPVEFVDEPQATAPAPREAPRAAEALQAAAPVDVEPPPTPRAEPEALDAQPAPAAEAAPSPPPPPPVAEPVSEPEPAAIQEEPAAEPVSERDPVTTWEEQDSRLQGEAADSMPEPAGDAPQRTVPAEEEPGIGQLSPGPAPSPLSELEPTGRRGGSLLPMDEPDTAEERPETATLGNLYRQQGHAEDAEQIFQRVLDREPDNATAKQGLDEITAGRRGPVDVSSLLGEESQEGGLSEKKATVLRNYLGLFNDAAEDDVS